MARSFSSFEAFADFLETRIAAAEHAKHLGLDAGANMMCRAAHDMVGMENASWTALADSTVARKQAAGQVGRISPTDPLYASGELRESWRYNVGNAGFVWGSVDPVMVDHEYGTSKMPPRPVVAPVMFQHGKEAVHMAANWIMGAAAGLSGPLRPGDYTAPVQDFKMAAE